MKVSVRNAGFGFSPQRKIIENISFETDAGHIMAVLGSNGAGKTTLLRCMLGFLDFSEGTVEYDGIPKERLDKREFRRKAAYVPQAKSMVFPYETLETVMLGRTPYLSVFSAPSEKDRKIAEEAMNECGISHLIGKKCNEISGGELQLVLIARALAQQPELLVMDEPETGLDFRNQLIVLNLTEKLCRRKNLTVIFNTHYPEHALRIADQTLLLMKDGRSLFGPVDEILTEDNMKEAFGVDILRFRRTVEGKEYTAVIPLSPREDTQHDQ